MMRTTPENPNEGGAWRFAWADLRRMGFLPALVLVTTLITCAGFGTIGPFAVKGYAWMLLFLVAAFHLLGQGLRSAFPLAIWVPWVVLVAASTLFSDASNALQRTTLLICPYLVGAALTCLPVRESAITAFLRGCRVLLGALFVVSLLRVGVLVTGHLPDVTGLSGESMTAAILAVVFAAEFASGDRRAAWFWTAALAVPVLAVTRGAVLATLCTLPSTLAPMRHSARFVVIALIAVLALTVFQSERVQRKMFQSGSGHLSDLRMDNPDLQTSGRINMWERLAEEARKKPWWGHGANAHEAFILQNIGPLTHPHNDWLRLFFDYGYVGAGLYGLTLLAQALHALRAARSASGPRRLCLYAGASGFIPFAVLMITDNIILYAGFFGNIHFALLGFGYSSHCPEPCDDETTATSPSQSPAALPGSMAHSLRYWPRPSSRADRRSG